MTKAIHPHPIHALQARESVILARLNTLDAQSWTNFDETAYRAKIATARADLARGLITESEVDALVSAREAAAASAKAEAPARTAAERERLELTDELNSVREALEEERVARRNRRRATARAAFAESAAAFRQHIAAAHALLPSLVAAGVHAYDNTHGLQSPMLGLTREIALPVFNLEQDGRQTFSQLSFDSNAVEAAINEFGAHLETIE